jgi:capsular polysaccharide biosynthesis protein
VEEELSLIDILRVLARRWKLIVAVALIPTVVVTGVLLMSKKPTYTSTAMVLVSGARATYSPPNPSEVTDPLANLPSASVVTYQKLAQDPGLAQRTIDQLGLGADPYRMTTSMLNQAVKVTVVNDSNLLQISVTLTDRDKAAAVANAIAQGVVARGESIATPSLSADQSGLTAAYESARIALTAKEQELAALLSKRDSASELTKMRDAVAAQLDGRRTQVQMLGTDVVVQLDGYRTQVQTLGTDIAALRLDLASRRTALVSTPQYLTTTKSITDDQTLLGIAQAASGQSMLDLAKLSMKSQEINPVWQSLSKDVTEDTALITYKTNLKSLYERTIPGLENRMLDLNKRIDAEQQTITTTQLEQDLLTSKFETTKTNYASSLQLQESLLPPVRIVQTAVPADVKDAGGKTTSVAVTFVAALLIGLMAAFLVDYLVTVRASEAQHLAKS